MQYDADNEDLCGRATRLRHWNTIRLGREMWQTQRSSQDDNVDTSGSRDFPHLEETLEKVRNASSAKQDSTRPYHGPNTPLATLYPQTKDISLQKRLEKWLENLSRPGTMRDGKKSSKRKTKGIPKASNR